MIALTKSLGKELAGYDIAVNAITPAAARTRIFDQMTQEHIDFMLSKIPRGRFVEPREIAAMVAWLAAPRTASRPARCSTFRAGARPIERRSADRQEPRARRVVLRSRFLPETV